jgi:hypothetical protein
MSYKGHPEVIEMIRQKNIGKKHSQKTKDLWSKQRQGKNNGNYGNKWTKKQKNNASKKQKERFKNKENHPRYKAILTQETKDKISKGVKLHIKSHRRIEI